MEEKLHEKLFEFYKLCQEIIVSVNKEYTLNKCKLIYHYTNAQGLFGIVQKKSFWATNSLFFNDPTEIKYGLKIALGELTNGLDKKLPKDDELYKEFSSINKMDKLYKNEDLYIVSFSSNGDRLSQWRGYGGFCKGFSIGIDTNKLQFLKTGLPTSPQAVDLLDFHLIKVIYNEEDQHKIMQNAVDKILDNLIKCCEENPKELRSLVKNPQ